jgi:hypothetical protein
MPRYEYGMKPARAVSSAFDVLDQRLTGEWEGWDA